ncbi:DNA-processing protein DprA [Sulfidibacter corallicola]|uniref:DNA-processing protein DprA n=1 Tax=Sulfidibacter corallicola TaxID=2818388 RepID=A0A8A4U2B6_SULCO|nr:DNA-processing protein DprA [Sulfidibacter corallicola]QTD52875.1 DNA-processing protein DprA [Sulfidibacter corallicola]
MLVVMFYQNIEEFRNALVFAASARRGPLPLLRAYQKARQHKLGLGPREWAELALAAEGIPRVRKEDAARLHADLTRRGISVTCLGDTDYPVMLAPLDDPPLVLFYRGDLACLNRPCAAIVGARACNHYGYQAAFHFAGDLARRGVTLVSGLALGIDGRAHLGALSVGGTTAAVLGSGLDAVYPPAHRDLADRIASEGGCLLSEFPPDATPRAHHFPIRNRIISGLSHAVLVVQARERSGSLITARHCLAQGRELFALPGPYHHPASAGPNGLVMRGEAQLVDSPETLAEWMGWLRQASVSEAVSASSGLKDPLALKIYDRLDAFAPVPLDTIVAELDTATGRVVAKLLELESRNMVERRPGQCYLRNPLHTAV